jgi:hypothetical protein
MAQTYHVRQIHHKGVTTLAATLALMFFCTAAKAQDSKLPPVDYCVTVPSQDVILKNPGPTTQLPWKKVFGAQGMDRFIAAARGEKDTLVLLGESRAFDIRTRLEGDRSLYVLTLNAKGDAANELRTVLPSAGRLRHVIQAGSDIVAIDDMTGTEKGNRFVWRRFDKTGKETGSTPLKIKGGEILDVSNIVSGKDVIYVALSQKPANGPKQSVLVGLNKSGAVQWQRTYLPGTENHLFTLVKNADNSLTGLGSVMLESGRQAAWLVNLTANGAFLGQAPLPRGATAILRAGKSIDANRWLYAGTVLAGDEKIGEAMWVMLGGNDGSPIWQRYITTRMHNLVPIAVNKLDDGRMVVLANAEPKAVAVHARPHVRQLVFAENGVLLDDQAFQQGAYSVASTYIPSAKADSPSLIVGEARSGFVGDDAPEKLLNASLDGLVIAMPPFKPYKDACK